MESVPGVQRTFVRREIFLHRNIKRCYTMRLDTCRWDANVNFFSILLHLADSPIFKWRIMSFARNIHTHNSHFGFCVCMETVNFQYALAFFFLLLFSFRFAGAAIHRLLRICVILCNLILLTAYHCSMCRKNEWRNVREQPAKDRREKKCWLDEKC